MKRVIRQFINLTASDASNEAFDNFFIEYSDYINSFDDVIKKENHTPFKFSSHDSHVVECAKKENAYVIRCIFNDNATGTEIGTAKVLFILRKPSKILKKLYEKNYDIISIYIYNHQIGIIYVNKNNQMDYLIEENTVEHAIIKSATVDIAYVSIPDINEPSYESLDIS